MTITYILTLVSMALTFIHGRSCIKKQKKKITSALIFSGSFQLNWIEFSLLLWPVGLIGLRLNFLHMICIQGREQFLNTVHTYSHCISFFPLMWGHWWAALPNRCTDFSVFYIYFAGIVKGVIALNVVCMKRSKQKTFRWARHKRSMWFQIIIMVIYTRYAWLISKRKFGLAHPAACARTNGAKA